MAKKLKDKEPESVFTPFDPSYCHNVELRWSPVYLVNNKGEQMQIGRAAYCDFVQWMDKKPLECFKINKLIMENKTWPLDLNPKSFSALIGDKPPGYWLIQGYHIALKDGLYTNMRSLDYLPPFHARADLIPLARRIVEFRDKHPIETVAKQFIESAKSLSDDEAY